METFPNDAFCTDTTNVPQVSLTEIFIALQMLVRDHSVLCIIHKPI